MASPISSFSSVGGERDLNEHHLASPLWMLVEERFEREQLLAHALDPVELVAADDDALASVLLAQLRHPLAHVGIAALGVEAAHVDADGEGRDSDKAAFELNALGSGFELEDAADGLAEVAAEVVGLEADEVGAEHSFEQRLAHAEAAEDLGRREGDVYE